MRHKFYRSFSRPNRQRVSSRGDTFITSLVILFILIGTLRLCNTKTIHEVKLTSIFVQETQGFYLMENLMHLARDYVYQIVQNPREPHLFLGASAFRVKDRLNEGTKYVIDFNHSLSKQQIVPDDFPLQVANNGWEIKGGPIFWKDNKKDAYDERYLSEVFMLGSLNLVSNLVPDWTMRTVQTIEIERNPLCDFQIYAEGDTTINTNINNTAIEVDGPVQINGNARFSSKNGDQDTYIKFFKKFNCAGFTLNMDGSVISDYVTPKKYHMYDNHENYRVTYATGGIESYYFNKYALNYNSTSMVQLATWHNNFNNNNYDSYERYMFNIYQGNFNTRSRVYRPIGFDPGNYWGFWDPNTTPQVSNTVDQDEQVLNYCFGFHNLAQSGAFGGAGLFLKTGENNYSPQYVMSKLRGLNTYQMTEKARLVEMQKPIDFPCILLKFCTNRNTVYKDESSLYVVNNFIFSTYIKDAFPPLKDNIYLNRYFNLAFQKNSIINVLESTINTINNTEFNFNLADVPRGCIESWKMYMDIINNKSSFHKVNEDYQLADIDTNSIVFGKSTFSPTGHGDDSCPPDDIVDNGTYWTLDNYVTRVTGEHYNFMYDRNRAKWIQIIDIDIGALTTALNASEMWNDSSKLMPIVAVNTWWQGKDAAQANKNYLYNGIDIRNNYSTNRTHFFTNYRDGSYVYPGDDHPVIDIGVRLINATTLPEKGLTFYSPYPLYIKGDFNTNNTKPALIVTDSLTLLPESWQDWRSQTDPIKSHLWYLDSTYTSDTYFHGTTIYADIITGRTHPHFYMQSADTTAIGQDKTPNSDFGIHDALRTLVDCRTPINLYGSLMLPYYCQEQWEPPINFCKKNSKGERNPTDLSYPQFYMHTRANAGIPAAMPFYYRISRGRKTHCIGEAAYNAISGTTLYNKDWFSGTFSDYHAALPNYLKYEVAP